MKTLPFNLGGLDLAAESRKEAKATSNPFYKGSVCRHGHIGLRYTACASCVHCRPKGKHEEVQVRGRQRAERLQEHRDLTRQCGEVWV